MIRLLAALAVMIGILTVAQPAQASSTGFTSYATMTVQAGAAARWDPAVYSNNLIGWVTSDGWKNPNGQASWVRCYADGGWATGNYRSNRWFLAYVNVTGYRTPVWAFVHSSFVTNQSGVPRC